MAEYKTLSGLDLDIGGFTESVTRSKQTLEEVSRKNRGIGAKPETEEIELDSNFLKGIVQLFRDNGYEPKQPSEDSTTTPKDEVLNEYSELMKSEIIQDAMRESVTLGESPNKLEDIYTRIDTYTATFDDQPTVDSESETLEITQTQPQGLMSRPSDDTQVDRTELPSMAEEAAPTEEVSVDSEILSPTFLNAIGITGSLTEKGVQTEVKKVLKEQGMSDEEIANLVNKSLAAIDADEVQLTDGKDSGEGLGSFEAIKTGMEEADPSIVEGMTFGKLKKDFVVGYLAGHEGIDPHKSIEGGKDTAAYGIKNSLGIERDNYKSGSEGDKDFAAAVALKHYEKAERKFKAPILDKYGKNTNVSDVWDDLGEAGRYALTDLHFNTGTVGDSAKASNAKDAITNTLNFINMTTKDKKTKGTLFSLAKRRALNWNKAADELGLTKIDKIQQMPRAGGGTIMNYLDAEGNVVHKVSNGRKPIKVTNNKGDYKILTTTREEEI